MAPYISNFCGEGYAMDGFPLWKPAKKENHMSIETWDSLYVFFPVWDAF